MPATQGVLVAVSRLLVDQRSWPQLGAAMRLCLTIQSRKHHLGAAPPAPPATAAKTCWRRAHDCSALTMAAGCGHARAGLGGRACWWMNL